jgi:hypothetical protein
MSFSELTVLILGGVAPESVSNGAAFNSNEAGRNRAGAVLHAFRTCFAEVGSSIESESGAT